MQTDQAPTTGNRPLDFVTHRISPLQITQTGVELAGQLLDLKEEIDFGAGLERIAVQYLVEQVRIYEQLTHGECRPQLAALLYLISGHRPALDLYFPITRVLNSAERQRFDALVEQIAFLPEFDLQLIDEQGNNIIEQLPEDAVLVVAGHLAEIFFYRQDILERFFAQPRHVRLYTSHEAFVQDGGVAGGDYHPEYQSVRLELARLYEGFYHQTPGVAPFLHEFGHMLEHFDPRSAGMMLHGEGLLPGLSPDHGQIYTLAARRAFLAGKRLELERYLAWHEGRAAANDPLPVGHPYVFRNDTEFIAGYFEMFFRNPNYFAALNPQLFSAFAGLFNYDPRPAWPQDFSGYIEENRQVYVPGAPVPAPGLTLPED